MPGRSLPHRASRGALAAALCAALLALGPVAGPAAADSSLGNGNSFSELTQGQPETTTKATRTTSPASRESSTNSNSTGLIVAISGAALVLLAGIGFVIVRDARRVAPAGDVQLNEARASRDSAARVRRRRARAKAARRQRKRNR